MKEMEYVNNRTIRMESKSEPGVIYYISGHPCPHCENLLWTCSCADFRMGITSRGGNPFQTPCKHIRKVIDNLSEVRDKVQEHVKGMKPEKKKTKKKKRRIMENVRKT